ncbi:hypothetical protein DOTSEDRAFT_32833 [Dothistroma septosporum NZE10]|uniref:Uncharacterized protein n=1 Tax=Dothistroma septosporum (strain NZE10 / CBS 128990) TaxID=675120 RepID=N1PT92_DOTSN|nr:hypothetical protein DOTSEDRAFT_32833 [Dothistroma septosporum NZE10]
MAATASISDGLDVQGSSATDWQRLLEHLKQKATLLVFNGGKEMPSEEEKAKVFNPSSRSEVRVLELMHYMLAHRDSYQHRTIALTHLLEVPEEAAGTEIEECKLLCTGDPALVKDWVQAMYTAALSLKGGVGYSNPTKTITKKCKSLKAHVDDALLANIVALGGASGGSLEPYLKDVARTPHWTGTIPAPQHLVQCLQVSAVAAVFRVTPEAPPLVQKVFPDEELITSQLLEHLDEAIEESADDSKYRDRFQDVHRFERKWEVGFGSRCRLVDSDAVPDEAAIAGICGLKRELASPLFMDGPAARESKLVIGLSTTPESEVGEKFDHLRRKPLAELRKRRIERLRVCQAARLMDKKFYPSASQSGRKVFLAVCNMLVESIALDKIHIDTCTQGDCELRSAQNQSEVLFDITEQLTDAAKVGIQSHVVGITLQLVQQFDPCAGRSWAAVLATACEENQRTFSKPLSFGFDGEGGDDANDENLRSYDENEPSNMATLLGPRKFDDGMDDQNQSHGEGGDAGNDENMKSHDDDKPRSMATLPDATQSDDGMDDQNQTPVSAQEAPFSPRTIPAAGSPNLVQNWGIKWQALHQMATEMGMHAPSTYDYHHTPETQMLPRLGIQPPIAGDGDRILQSSKIPSPNSLLGLRRLPGPLELDFSDNEGDNAVDEVPPEDKAPGGVHSEDSESTSTSGEDHSDSDYQDNVSEFTPDDEFEDERLYIARCTRPRRSRPETTNAYPPQEQPAQSMDINADSQRRYPESFEPTEDDFKQMLKRLEMFLANLWCSAKPGQESTDPRIDPAETSMLMCWTTTSLWAKVQGASGNELDIQNTRAVYVTDVPDTMDGVLHPCVNYGGGDTAWNTFYELRHDPSVVGQILVSMRQVTEGKQVKVDNRLDAWTKNVLAFLKAAKLTNRSVTRDYPDARQIGVDSYGVDSYSLARSAELADICARTKHRSGMLFYDFSCSLSILN